MSTKDYQIIFVDTPGIAKPINRLGKVLNRKAMEQIDDVDCILFVVDGKKGIGPENNKICSFSLIIMRNARQNEN